MDWIPIIKDLERSLTQAQIATITGLASQSHVGNLKSGRQKKCSYEIGCKLVELHRKTMRAGRKAAAKKAARLMRDEATT